MNDKEIEARNLAKPPERVLEEFAREVQGISSQIETNLYVLSKIRTSATYQESDLQGIATLVKALNTSVAIVESYLEHKKHNTSTASDVN